jgi:hypothetical protein
MKGNRWFCFQETFVHGLVLGEEIETTSPLLATKTAPDHHTGAVPDSGDGEVLLVAVQSAGPPNFLFPGVNQPKSQTHQRTKVKSTFFFFLTKSFLISYTFFGPNSFKLKILKY